MKLTFIGAAHEVTGSCHYLEVNGKHILVDYGMEQGVNYFDTAFIYPGSESAIGEIFQKNNIRDKVYIATKLPP